MSLIDKYSIQARLYPVIIMFMPLLVVGIGLSLEYENWYNSLYSLGLTSVLSYFLSNIGRDAGKKKEELLWNKWGGIPTTLIMLDDNNIITSATKLRYKAHLEILCPLNNSSISEEEKIKSWTSYLRAKTRDDKKFGLLFKENISYGFRRNLLGLKPYAIGIIVFSAIINYTIFYIQNKDFNPLSYSPEWSIICFVLFVIALMWIFIVNENWVKIPAFGYAERLFETTEELYQPNNETL